MTSPKEPPGIEPGGSLIVSVALVLWLLIKASHRFVLWLERHDAIHHPTEEEHLVLEPRPRPLRTIASWVGLITALVTGLVGSGLLTTGQGDAINGVVTAVLALLGAFGIALVGERKVTPTADPRDNSGRALQALDTD